jgi:hypothetical protein
MAIALGLGLLASFAFFMSASVYAYPASFVAGLIAAWLVPERTRGLVGLVLGIVGAYAVWGTNEVIKRINTCGDSCGGLSSPSLTAWIVIGFAAIGVALAVGGFVVGRVIRRFVSRRSIRAACITRG